MTHGLFLSEVLQEKLPAVFGWDQGQALAAAPAVSPCHGSLSSVGAVGLTEIQYETSAPVLFVPL